MARKRKEITETTYTYWGWNSEEKKNTPIDILKVGENGVEQEHIVILRNVDMDIGNQEDKIRDNTDYAFENKRNRAADANCDDVIDPFENIPDIRNNESTISPEMALLLKRLSVHMEKLTESQINFIYQYYGEGLSFAEIARREGVTEGAIRHRNTKIINRLRKLFEAEEHE